MSESPTVQIKPYERINDKELAELISENLFHTQGVTPSMLVEGAIMKYGLLRIIIFLLLFFFLAFNTLAFSDLGTIAKIAVSVILEASVIFLLYGYIFPTKEMRRLKKEVPGMIAKELSDVKGKFMLPGSHFWLAMMKESENSDAEKIVGCVLVEPYDAKKDYTSIMGDSDVSGEVAQLRRMSVDASIRRQGIGGKLIAEVKKFCLQNGYKTLMLTTFPSNKVAISFYQKLGFVYKKKVLVNFFSYPLPVAVLVMKL